jgi:hypothetical protein
MLARSASRWGAVWHAAHVRSVEILEEPVGSDYVYKRSRSLFQVGRNSCDKGRGGGGIK